MRNRLLLPLLIVISQSINGCAVTGQTVNERRHGNIVLIDKRIESDASRKLKADDEIENNCHVNVAAYNGTALVTGEALTPRLRNKIISIVRTIPDIKQIHNVP